MTYVSLGDIMDGISAYSKLFDQFKYKEDGTGSRSWSKKMVADDGSTIEFRSSDWVYSGSRGTHEGVNASDLKTFLLDGLDRTQLIALLTT